MIMDIVLRWVQALALIAALSTSWLAIMQSLREDRLVKRQMARLDELEKVASIAPEDLAGHIRTLQREVVADYLATVVSGSWNRIGVAKLSMAGTGLAVTIFSILTGTLISSPLVGLGMRNTGVLIPFSLVVGIFVAGIVGWLVFGPILGRRQLREELHRRFTRTPLIDVDEEGLHPSSRQRRIGNIVGAVEAIAMFLGLVCGTVVSWSLIAGTTQPALVTVSAVVMVVAFCLAVAMVIVVSKGPEKYGELVLKGRNPARSTH